MDIDVEAIVELVVDSSMAVVGGKADTRVEPIMDSSVEITAGNRGYSTGVEGTP